MEPWGAEAQARALPPGNDGVRRWTRPAHTSGLAGSPGQGCGHHARGPILSGVDTVWLTGLVCPCWGSGLGSLGRLGALPITDESGL